MDTATELIVTFIFWFGVGALIVGPALAFLMFWLSELYYDRQWRKERKQRYYR